MSWVRAVNLLVHSFQVFLICGFLIDCSGRGNTCSKPPNRDKIIVKRLISNNVTTRGGVKDTKFEAKAKDTKKIRGQRQGQGQPFEGQTLLRPRTGMLKANAKDQGHRRKCSPKKRFSKKFFMRSLILRRTQNF